MVAALAVAVLQAGCKNEDDEFAPAVLPKTFVFQGNQDPKYVGKWASSDGMSTLSIVKDGTLSIDTTVRSVAGKSSSHVAGQWLVDGSSLLFKYQTGSQPPTVLKYAATLSGSTLSLLQDGSKARQTYHRK